MELQILFEAEGSGYTLGKPSLYHEIRFSPFILTVRNAGSSAGMLQDDRLELQTVPLGDHEFARGTFFPSLLTACPCKLSIVDGYCYYDYSTLDERANAKEDTAATVEFKVDPHLVSCIVYAVCSFPKFRSSFVRFAKQICFKKSIRRRSPVCFRMVLDQTVAMKVDRAWEDGIWILCMWNELVKEHLAWLSTLGGAFSALGKIGFRAFAERAGKISVSQLRLAEFLGDPILMARSRIFLALSLIQQEQYHLAKQLLRKELVLSRSELVSSESEKLESIIRSVWQHLVFDKKQRKTLEEERNLVKRASRLVFDDETMRSKKSLADTILAMSSVKLVHSVC